MQVKGSGIANTCPVMEGGSSNLKDLKPGNYTINKFCLEPTSFTVKEESQFKGGETEFVKTKLMTRLTYTLDEVCLSPALPASASASKTARSALTSLAAQISGKFNVDGSGGVEFKEEDGIDYAPVTVQLPGGERVPFLFTIKELDAKGSLEGFGGDFTVPSYRGSSFLDPKARVLVAALQQSSACIFFSVVAVYSNTSANCESSFGKMTLRARSRGCVAGPWWLDWL